MSSQSMDRSTSDAQTVKNVEDKEDRSKNDSKSGPSDLSYKFKAGLFLTSVAGVGFLAGFGGSLAATKKKGFQNVFSFFCLVNKNKNSILKFKIYKVNLRIITCTQSGYGYWAVVMF